MSQISFPIPKDFVAPDDLGNGDEFKQLVTFCIKGKNLVIKSIGDQSMPEQDESEPAPDDNFATAVSKQL